MPQPHGIPCVEDGSPFRKRLGTPEAVVIIVVIGIGAMAVSVAGLPVAVTLQLLAGAGLIAVTLVGLMTGSSPRALGRVLRGLMAQGA